MMNLAGSWKFCLDKEKKGLSEQWYLKDFEDTIILPTTTSEAKKGEEQQTIEIGCLTDPFLFEGYAWYAKEVELQNIDLEASYTFSIERSRITHVWVNAVKVGKKESLCTSHEYDVTKFLTSGINKITVMVDNTEYKTRGGHMTSPDTQTNWNGILGEIRLEKSSKGRIKTCQIYPSRETKNIQVCFDFENLLPGEYQLQATIKLFKLSNEEEIGQKDYGLQVQVLKEKKLENLTLKVQEASMKQILTYDLSDSYMDWDEYSPYLYKLTLELYFNNCLCHVRTEQFGFREFSKEGLDLKVNGRKIFLRGKHDGLIFPLTGYAPMDIEGWLKVLKIAKDYGMNHYRFHTCCPPKAAFLAADLLGIYMEPELPFWGTIAEEGQEYYNHDERVFLVEEGFRILEEFGNYPSFFAFSMGNELWGSKEAINKIMGDFKKSDPRHFYTQGSNNHQFVPSVLEQDDFFCGVRFSKHRLFRGSYAMCDAPQGHVQMDAPSTMVDYDQVILPENTELLGSAKIGDEIEIQYGTGVKKVVVEQEEEVILPNVPVISHEIGQYETAPNYDEIKKYTGVLKARNLETFQKRLEEKGLFDSWKACFMASGKLAADCYQRELESAFNSSLLSGFQLLDLQDFSGQGTALVGVLDAFMENKGTISQKQWRSFCSDQVLLPNFSGFVYEAGDEFLSEIRISHFKPECIASGVVKTLMFLENNGVYQLLEERKLNYEEITGQGLFSLGIVSFHIPEISTPSRIRISFSMEQEELEKSYILWVYPKEIPNIEETKDVETEYLISSDFKQVEVALKEGKKVLYFPGFEAQMKSIEGTYATDFWCYPMFRSISESVKRKIPVGTLGLLIDDKHKALELFPSEYYSTPQWFSIVMQSRSTILDDLNITPIVRTIDNFERNHNLGLLYEMKVGTGKLLVCTSMLPDLMEHVEAKWFYKSLVEYMKKEDFQPVVEISLSKLQQLFQ